MQEIPNNLYEYSKVWAAHRGQMVRLEKEEKEKFIVEKPNT